MVEVVFALLLIVDNKIAKKLKDRRYHQRVIKNKKAYDRKKISKSSYRDS